MISWIYLIFAIIFEVSGTISMKLSDGFTNIKYAIVMIGFLYIKLKHVDISFKEGTNWSCIRNLVRHWNNIVVSHWDYIF